MAESVFNAPLSEVDPEIAEVLELELGRQRDYLEMIASENFVPVSVLQSQGSVLTNKYAEGYPGRRYYGGCEYVDVAESLAIERAKSLFGAEYANVQPHSGATANAAVLSPPSPRPGDTILGLELAHGGHLTHGMKLNFSGKLYNAVAYGVDPETFLVDMNVVRDKALEHKPQVIIAGWSAYPRQLDFAAFRAIADEVGAKLWVDMAHFAGLVAAGLHPSPVPYADVVSSTVHKTIGGPRSGFIVARDMELAKKLNSNVFPGQQGGPLMHVIAAKATAFKIAARAEFKDRQERTIRGAQILAERLTADDSRAAGVDVLTGGTDVHLVLADLRNSQIDGQQAEDLLHEALITVNRNAVPFDPRPPMVTSGLRIGTPALATRGFGDAEFTEVADIIALALQGEADVAGAPRPRRDAHRARSRCTRACSSRAAMTAITLDGVATASAVKPKLAERIAHAARPRRRARARHRCSSATTRVRSRTSRASTATAPRWASSRSASTCPHRPRTADVRAAIRDLNDAREVTGYIVQLPLPAGHRRERDARAHRPRQGRRRPAPDEPRPARARHRGRPALAAAVHAGGHRRDAAPLRRADPGPARHGHRPRPHRRPSARAALHPQGPRRDRHPHALAHRRPRRPRCAGPTSSSPPSACRTS